MTAIPKLTRKHVCAALDRIDREGYPASRRSTRYHLVERSKRYPPKYVISLAAEHATGYELAPEEFSGGPETNQVLERLGFTIVGPNNEPARSTKKTAAEQSITRVVVRGAPSGSPSAASEMLMDAFGPRWPTAAMTKFTITPGGFISGALPCSWERSRGWDTRPGELPHLARAAEPYVRKALTKTVLRAAKKRTRVLTLGVDIFDDDNIHAELVAVVDCPTGEIVRWTGKSYPVLSQERRLVHVSRLSSHLLRIAGERVLVLGCHDLNMFSNRGRANQDPKGRRRHRCDQMRRSAKDFRPTVVLQHPHSTDSANIWRMPWACLARELPSVHTWASGISYNNWGSRCRKPLKSVLEGTRSEAGVLDVVVKKR